MKPNEDKRWIVGTTFSHEGGIYTHVDFFSNFQGASKYKDLVDSQPGVILCEILDGQTMYETEK